MGIECKTFVPWKSQDFILESSQAIRKLVPKEREINGTKWKGQK